jgi:hypothetical protein
MNQSSPNAEVLRRTLLTALVAVYFSIVCWVPGWMALLGIDHYGVWFLDTHALLAASDAHVLGLDPMDPNPLDFFHQPHVYSHWWFALSSLSVTRADYWWLGGLLGFAFLAVALLQVGVRSTRELVVSALTLTAPCMVLGFNRGNADLLIFIILAGVVPCLLSPHLAIRWIGVILILGATGLKFYPALAGLVLLGVNRSQREILAQLIAFTFLLVLLAINQAEDLQRYVSVEGAPEGFFTFGVGLMAKSLPLPYAGGTIIAFAIPIGLAVLWWRVAPTCQVPESRRADYFAFIMGAALLTGCYFVTINYAYRRVFAIFTVPFLVWAWDAPQRLRWFRLLGRVTTVLLIGLLWLDGLLCLAINLFVHTSPAEMEQLTTRLVLAQQPFVATARIGLLAFLVPFVRDAFRFLSSPAPAELPAPAGPPAPAIETPGR